jgi:ribonuclease HI
MAARSQAQQQANHHTLHGQSPFSKETTRFNHTHELPPQINNSVAEMLAHQTHALLSVPFSHNVLIFSDSKSTIEAITPNTQHWSPMMWRVANYPPTLIKQIRTIIDQRL